MELKMPLYFHDVDESYVGGDMIKKRMEILTQLEEQYAKFFLPDGALPPASASDADSLEQPSPLQNVPSITTYGTLEIAIEA